MIQDPIIRRCVRLLAAVHELHKQGYQNLAIFPHLAPAGTDWRCSLTSFNNIFWFDDHWVITQHRDVEVSTYSSGEKGNDYFGWIDAQNSSARDLAEKIKNRFPRLMSACANDNYRYAGWFSQMLGFAEQGHLPVMSAEYSRQDQCRVSTTTTAISIPAPPLGTMWKFQGKRYCYRQPPHLSEGEDWHIAYRAMVDRWRSEELCVLPAYPTDSDEITEFGAYWEGAVYYIQQVLGFSRIDDFLRALREPPKGSERWHVFLRCWNDQGQLVFLKAFMVRLMLSARDRYPLKAEELDYWRRWLDEFENSIEIKGLRGRHLVNPYFGGQNALHLGLILDDVPGERLI